MNLRHPWPLVAIACGLLLTFGLSSSAFASTTGPAANGHYYGVAEWFPSVASNGAYADLYIQSGNAKDYASGGMPIRPYGRAPTAPTMSRPFKIRSKPDTSTASSPGSNATTPSYYWADQRPNSALWVHKITSITPTIGTWKPIDIKYLRSDPYYNFSEASGNQDCYINSSGGLTCDSNTAGSVSTSNPPNTMQSSLKTGLETTSDIDVMTASTYSSGIEYLTTGGTWTSWTRAYLPVNSPATAT